MNMKQLKLILACSAASLLWGCSPMNGSFDCNKVGGMGAGCVSLDQVNQMASQGQFNQTPGGMAGIASSTSSGASSSGATSLAGVAAGMSSPSPYQIATPMPGAPVRVGETSQRLWVAPWVDTEGHYHEPSYIYFVTAPGYWVGSPQTGIANGTE